MNLGSNKISGTLKRRAPIDVLNPSGNSKYFIGRVLIDLKKKIFVMNFRNVVVIQLNNKGTI
jgi:hypothetical protein